jgi:hypothetical protein
MDAQARTLTPGSVERIMAEVPPCTRTAVSARRAAGAPFWALLALPALSGAAIAADGTAPAEGTALSSSDSSAPGDDRPAHERAIYGHGSGPPPERTPGVPSDAELEADKAVIGTVMIDNQDIFNLQDPKDDTWLFRLANRLHIKTRASVIRAQLLFRPGERYSRRLLDETERILRADGYFYDAWIRVTAYHDGKVDVRVTTKDVWTINPGFNFGRSGGSNSTGAQLEDVSFLGTGIDLAVSHSSNIDRTSNQVTVTDQHLFGTFTAASLNYADLSDGHLREFSAQSPFYALDTHWAAGVYGLNDLQTDSLWDRSAIIDQFADQHSGAQIYGGLSEGLSNGWVRRWSAGLTYDEHLFSPVSTWAGPTLVPEDRRFVYPWIQFDLIQDDFLRIWNHDQIARTEDFYLGTAASARVGWADSAYGSSQSALIFQSNASSGWRAGGSTLRLFGDFSGRVEDGRLRNGVMDGSVRYYVEQSKNWLFFTTLLATKGWNLDLDDQILLGGDSGLRGYPLRYQDGDARALWTVEQRYFTDWYPFRLFRVGGAVFFDAGRTWGTEPLAVPNYAWLTDAGFGLRLGNARTALGNVVHVDVAFPFNGDATISRIQFLIQTEHSF